MKPIIKVNNLSKSYKSKKAVKDVSFTVKRGEILGILGPNGSGKTTTLKSMIGLINFEDGEIDIIGHNIKKQPKKILDNLGAVLEGSRNIYWALTPKENLEYFSALKGISAKKNEMIPKLLKILDLEKVKNQPVREFSRGMQQKVSLACALVNDPQIILLDEPTLGLDVEISRIIKNYLLSLREKEGKTILITSHDMKFIEDVCDRVLIIKEGEIISQESIVTLRNQHQKNLIEILIKNLPSERFLNILVNRWNLEHKIEGNNTILRIVLSEINEMYELMNIFAQNEIEMLNLTCKPVELEEIFLTLTRSEVVNV